jgi:DNA-binding PadR family transcriptional regulator
MHGYEMLQEISQRSQDVWRPSPGSLYPALQMLEDQGLVRSVESDGRRMYELTDAGREEAAKRPAGPTPWDVIMGGADQGSLALHLAIRQVAIAVEQVAEAGTDDQKARAEQLLTDLRRQIYLLLAEPATPQA